MQSPAPSPTDATPNGDAPRGFAFALAAYLIWGVMPVYMKALSHIGTLEVLAHRVIWSVPVALAVLLWQGRTADLRAALRRPRTLAMAVVPAALISVNWGIYVYSIQSGQAMEAAIGYYINPLFSILLARLLLGERLTPLKWLAVAMAGTAVAVLTVSAGQLPLLALSMTVSWGFYAYFKKSLPLGPNQGFALEALLILPFALAGAIWLAAQGQSAFVTGSAIDVLMLLGCGLVTAVPLMIYANAAKLLRLSTIGIMQYISPSLIFLTAWLVFGEPLDSARMIVFPIIWGAMAIYSLALIREARAGAPSVPAPSDRRLHG